MNGTRFDEPVTVLIGMGLPVRIDSVTEAYALLRDWPVSDRDGSHAVALNACKGGVAGEIDPETVRSIFVAFARRNDMLVANMDSPMTPAVSTGGASGPEAKS